MHEAVTTLAELLELNDAELMEGYMSTEKGDPEPGDNRSRAFHHGWRMRMMDLGEIQVPIEHTLLVREYVAWMRHQSSTHTGTHAGHGQNWNDHASRQPGMPNGVLIGGKRR